MAVGTVHHFLVEPRKGVGPIRFGMHKDEASRAFPYVYRSFFKSPDSKVRADQCEVVGLTVHYDDASRVNHIEVFKTRHAAVTLELLGRDITGISVKGLVEFLVERGVRAERSRYGYDFPALGLSTFNSHLESEAEPVECLGVGPPDGTRRATEPCI
jgi:hypothetical protein